MPKVRTLVGAVFLLVAGLPIVFAGVLQILDDALIAHTEQTLVAEAVAVGEVYRRTIDPVARKPLGAVAGEEQPYHPIDPRLSIERPLVVLEPSTRGPIVRTATVSGHELSPLLERIAIRNLSGLRVLDADGTVVATASKEIGYSLAHLPEVKAALRGSYAPVLRRRYSDEPAPPVSSISRAANVRVSIAVPIFKEARTPIGSEAEVIGVVYSNRTPLDVEKAVWLWRDKLTVPAAATVLATLGLAVLLTLAISLPIGRLRRSAELVAAGDSKAPIETGRFAPHEIRDLERSIAKMRDQLEARAGYIGEFAANTAHELKTPLTSLRGAAEILLEDDEGMTLEQRRRFLSNIHSDAVRMDALVGRILDLARIESSKPIRETIDLESFLEGTVERHRRGGHELVLSFGGKEWIDVAPDQLESLVSNLIDNAIRHGAGRPVEVAAFDELGAKVIVVRDHGPKLEPGSLDRAFERFYTTTRNQGGTGLGLAIVKAVAEAHGGSVVAAVEEDGASFTVRLPQSF